MLNLCSTHVVKIWIQVFQLIKTHVTHLCSTPAGQEVSGS